jgi:hypothetical protein
MFDFTKGLFQNHKAWPDLFELVSATRSSSWSLRWEGDHLMYRQVLPPIEIFPTPGSKPDEKRVAITTSADQWQLFWKIVDQTSAWEWAGNYSWTDKVKVLGGQHWKLSVSRGDNRVKCEGGGTLDTTPPAFLRFLESVVSMAGEDKLGPMRMLKYLREQENNVRG